MTTTMNNTKKQVQAYFVVRDGDRIVDELSGMLIRPGREFYVNIKPLVSIHPDAGKRWGHRKARIVIKGDFDDKAVLERNVDIGVTVLIGTDIPWLPSTKLYAQVVP